MKRLPFAAISAVMLLAGLLPGRALAQDVVDVQVTVSPGWTYLPACGLFGPSKRELMGRMIENQHAALYQAQAAHATLISIQVEQARQTEILRQIAGQTARAADNTQRAADAGQDLKQYMLTKPLRDYPALPSDAPRNLRALPDVPPTLPDLRGTQSLPSDAPGSLRNTPSINVEGPILQGTSGRLYYTKSTTTVQRPATARH